LLSKNKKSETDIENYMDYNHLKEAEGEIMNYYSKISSLELDENSRLKLSQLMTSLRNAMYSAKGMKDVAGDFNQLKNSSNDFKFEAYSSMQKFVSDFYEELQDLLFHQKQEELFEKLSLTLKHISMQYEKWTTYFILESKAKK